MPHLIWLTENNYTTITYGFHRTATENLNNLHHIKHPLIFLGKQMGILMPFFLMLSLLTPKLKTKFNFKDDKLLFLLVINIAPLALVFLTSMIMGVKIRTMWMTPFYLFFGVLVIYIYQSQINLNKLKGFASVFIILFIFSPFAYAYISITETGKRTDYPGKEVANEVQKKWNSLFVKEKQIKTVYGNEWDAGNLSYHLKSRPKVIIGNPEFFVFPSGVTIGWLLQNYENCPHWYKLDLLKEKELNKKREICIKP